MTLETFCDLVWAEIWDDCPPLGDQARYRDIMVRLFIDGDEPDQITWVDDKGKTHRLSDTKAPSGGKASKADMAKLAEMHERIRQLKLGGQVASPDDG